MKPLRPVPPAAPPDLEIRTALDPPALHVRVAGELDLATAPRLDVPELLMPDQVDVRAVVLDLSRLEFCDVAGLRALLRYRNAHTELHRLVMARHVPPSVVRLMRLVNVSERFLL